MNIRQIMELYNSRQLLTEDIIREIFTCCDALIKEIPDNFINACIDKNVDEILFSPRLNQIGFISCFKNANTEEFYDADVDKILKICPENLVDEVYFYLHSNQMVLNLNDAICNEDNANDPQIKALADLFDGECYLSGNTLFIPMCKIQA